MRTFRLPAWLLLLLLGGITVVGNAQPAAPPPAVAASPAPANPGTAPLFLKHTDFGVDCITCHDEDPPGKAVPTAVCLSCHGSYDSIADKSNADGDANPHASHNGDLDCDNCHHVHKASENYCAQCHQFNFDVP